MKNGILTLNIKETVSKINVVTGLAYCYFKEKVEFDELLIIF